MNHTAKETESGAIREIEPEIRTLFTKVVERDPREAAKMLEPYPDEFVVNMLELLNPIAALDILERFDPPRRQTILATASPEDTQQWDAESNVPGADHRTINATTFGSFPSANNGGRGNRTDSKSGEKSHHHVRLCYR